jgi:hypothetical protein
MVILELCEIIDVAVDNDPQGIRLVFRRDVALGKDLGHGVGAATGAVHQASDGGIQRQGRKEAMEVVGEEEDGWLFAKETKRGGDQVQ